jgi:hypothetical protein
MFVAAAAEEEEEEEEGLWRPNPLLQLLRRPAVSVLSSC